MNKFLSIFFLILLFSMMVVGHETTHKEIFRIYGCDSEYGLDWRGPYTKAVGDCENHPDMIKLHAWNEIIGYNIMPLLTLYVWMWLVKNAS